MRIKTILAAVEATEYRDSVLNLALLLGRATGSYIEGCPLGLPYSDFVAVSPVGGVAVPMPAYEPSVAPEDLHRSFMDFMQENGVPEAPVPAQKLCFGWTGDDLYSDIQFGSHARVFDVIVVGRPNSDRSGPRVTTVEHSLFEGGRPVLITPPAAIEKLGQTVVVAWNCSTEAARAVSFATGLLEAAQRVVVLTIEDGTVAGPSGVQLCKNLHAHGIDAEELTVPMQNMSIGEAILHHSKELSADLIIKGAYTHSRLRQMIFGGATSHLLYNANLPVLMAS